MKMRILTLGSCLAISLFVVWYGFVLPEDASAAPSGKCCLETGGCVDVSSTDCDAMCGVFSGPGPDGSLHIFTVGAYYNDKLVHTDDGWRIAERFEEQAYFDGSLPEGFTIQS